MTIYFSKPFTFLHAIDEVLRDTFWRCLEEIPGVAKNKEGAVYFIKDVIPGDVVDVQVYKKGRKKFWEARIEKIHTYSDRRTEPKCDHFGVCGGCKWQHLIL